MLVIGGRNGIVWTAGVIVGRVLVVGVLEIAVAVAQGVAQAVRRGIGNEHEAVLADDPQIRRQLTQEFPSLTDDQAKIETSCLAEYVEREIARQHNTVPPDERDDHGGG